MHQCGMNTAVHMVVIGALKDTYYDLDEKRAVLSQFLSHLWRLCSDDGTYSRATVSYSCMQLPQLNRNSPCTPLACKDTGDKVIGFLISPTMLYRYGSTGITDYWHFGTVLGTGEAQDAMVLPTLQQFMKQS